MELHAPENFDTPNTINKATKLSTKEMWREIERRSKKAKKKNVLCVGRVIIEADTKN